MSKKPTGWVARCQCGVNIGCLDLKRTPINDASRLIGGWLQKGCTLEPRFTSNWSVSLGPCACAHQPDQGAGAGEMEGGAAC